MGVGRTSILDTLAELSLQGIDHPDLPRHLDRLDPLQRFRKEFHIPSVAAINRHSASVGLPSKTGHPDGSSSSSDDEAIYLCGNSLGLQPIRTKALLDQELQIWAQCGVHGHFNHQFDRPWVSIDDNVIEESARIVGAEPDEVAIMNSLTVNVHLLMVPFYRPTTERFKIIMEGKAFPSDYYAIESQVKFHGLDPKTTIVEIDPRDGEYALRTEDILATIRREGSSTALVLISGIQYYTGQFFDIEAIAQAAREQGCLIGVDLAHAVGNVPLELHRWQVDFACWCSYKYLNSGPGGIGGAFVHSKHAGDSSLSRFAGWWGTNPATKFQMSHEFEPIAGAAGYRLSNPSVLATIALLGSLQVFAETDMASLRHKSVRLTAYLELLVEHLQDKYPGRLRIITPLDESQRGCQLSLLFLEEGRMMPVFERLLEHGVVCDERKPDVIRVAPAPLYNSFADVYQFFRCLDEALAATL
ncbi:pyridoxal phosphate-dependent transferase [Polychytrium aggregatum]|uniref:pyridoxal phosphate-dependent transferase n=1 Tax=Polychytrium aggregatum TaxID=110093 RepID=UPI0022FDC5E1|nr:pyridoxal phosphate-dependent transferase [Polychytrium aggregatum]KAI9207467.1 pyridoxal phosphate-dependent transferase [Polychytrium aggregatum]